MRMRTYVAVAVNIIGRSVTAMGTRALQWKGDRTAMQRRQDCSGKTPWLQWKDTSDSDNNTSDNTCSCSSRIIQGIWWGSV
jgi:hypothetical protein